MNKTIKSQRSKAIDTATLKFVKAVEDSTTYDEMFNFIDTANNQLDVIMEQEGYKKFE